MGRDLEKVNKKLERIDAARKRGGKLTARFNDASSLEESLKSFEGVAGIPGQEESDETGGLLKSLKDIKDPHEREKLSRLAGFALVSQLRGKR